MATIKTILTTTDLSAAAGKALPHALALAKAFDAELHLVHVVEENLYADYSYAEGMLNPGAMFEDLVKARRDKLEDIASDLPAGVKTHIHIRRGIVACEILDAAKDLSADLIVIATHGRTGLAHLFLGSVAERVVRESPCPVYTVPAKTPKKE